MEKADSDISIIGHVFEAELGEKTFHLFYENKDTLILTDVRGPDMGKKQILTVKITELRPNLYMVNWQEANKTAVTDIEDYENGIVYANVTTPSNKFLNIKGTLRCIK